MSLSPFCFRQLLLKLRHMDDIPVKFHWRTLILLCQKILNCIQLRNGISRPLLCFIAGNGLGMAWTCASTTHPFSLCVLTCASFMMYLEDTVSLKLSTTFGWHSHSTFSLSAKMSGPQGGRF